MTQHVRCPECDATVAVPPTGLEMQCQYCGFQQAVPDAAKRRAKQEAAERKAEKEKRRDEAEEKRRKEKIVKRRARIGRSIVTAPFRLVVLLPVIFPVLIVGFVFYQQGASDALLDDATRSLFAGTVSPIGADGFVPLSPPEEKRVMMDVQYSEHKALEAGKCYRYLAVSTGLTKHAWLANATGRNVATQNELSQIVDFSHCPPKSQIYTIRLMFGSTWGSFTQQWFVADRVEQKTAPAVADPKAVRMKKKKRRGKQ